MSTFYLPVDSLDIDWNLYLVKTSMTPCTTDEITASPSDNPRLTDRHRLRHSPLFAQYEHDRQVVSLGVDLMTHNH